MKVLWDDEYVIRKIDHEGMKVHYGNIKIGFIYTRDLWGTCGTFYIITILLLLHATENWSMYEKNITDSAE